MSEVEGRNILIVDDEEGNIDILLELLSDKYEVYAATDGETALEIVKEEPIDLVLLDVMMPGMSGYEVCEKLKADPETKDIPVIFITALTDEESIEKGFDVGGSDYITKPFKPREVLARVKTQLQLRAYYEELQRLATTDPLTGLYNRRYFAQVARHLFESAKRYSKPLSVMLLDIDRFKSINDTYGHDTGDLALKVLADILKNSIRESDIACRFGGEEFIILLPETTAEDAEKLADRIRSKVENSSVPLSDGKELRYTVSIGVAQVDLSVDENIEPAIKRADEALYRAKEEGRNRVVLSR